MASSVDDNTAEIFIEKVVKVGLNSHEIFSLVSFDKAFLSMRNFCILKKAIL